MDWVKIGNRTYDVIVSELKENFNILYSENTGRTIAQGAPMTLDPLGTFYGHTITFTRKNGYEKDFDDLYDYVSTPRYSGINVNIVHDQTTINYQAYVSNGERTLKRIDDKSKKVYWDSLQLNIIPMKAQKTT